MSQTTLARPVRNQSAIANQKLTLAVDLDERGSFRAHVENANGECLFDFSNEDESGWPSEDGLWLEDRRPNPNAFPELTESALSRFVCEVRRHHGDLEFVKAVEVTHPRPPHAAEYDRVFAAPVTFGAARNAMRIAPSWLSAPVRRPDGYVFGVFIEHAEGLMARLAEGRTLRGRVEGLLAARLHKGPMSMAEVAGELNMSQQTLYRRLKDEGASFEAVLEALRRDLAEGYLSSRKLSVNETAYLLGFSDPSAFSRAYKRWTGASPKAAKG